MKRFLISVLCVMAVLPSLYAQRRSVAIVAHRGYWNCEQGGMSHNSLASARQCEACKFWGSEFDVNMTSDGVLLVYHDSSIKINGDKLKIQDNPASAFRDVKLNNGESIPTLDEYLKLFEGSGTRLVFELKSHTGEDVQAAACEKCVAALRAHGLFDPEQVIFISFQMTECQMLAKLAPGFTVQYLGSEYMPSEIQAKGVNGVDTEYHTFYKNKAFFDEAKKLGMRVNVWTVDKEEDIRRMIELGADYITTNNPELVRSILKDMHVKELKCGKNFK